MKAKHQQAGRRVVITGLGVVAPNGIGKEEFWQSCVAGKSGIQRITRFDPSMIPSQVAGEVANFDAKHLGLTDVEAERLDRGSQFAVAAANLALRDAGLYGEPAPGLSEEEREQWGVYIGSAMAYAEEGELLWVALTSGGTHAPSPELPERVSASMLITHSSAQSIAAHHQLHGPCMVVATGCSAGADAIGEAYWLIQDGRAECMLAGGSDAAISPTSLDVFCVIGALSTGYNDEPWRASRPYDGKRDGFVMSEGSGVVVLEEREHALARGAHIYAEIIAYCSNTNAYHMTALPADGAPLRYLIEQAMEETGLVAEEIDYINSHGSSTLPNEGAETAAYKAVFGEQAYHIPISATKSMIGHTQGAASAIEVVVTALALDRQMIPPTINQESPDPLCDLDYVPNAARPATLKVALTHSSGFGGVNNVLILTRP